MNTIRVNTLDLGALLSAFLDALSNASDEELLRHRSKLHSASRKLQELPIIALPPCSDRSEPTPPPSECEDTLLSLSDRLDSPRPSPEDENALPSSGSETDLPPTHREPLPEKNALPALCKRHEPPPTVPSSNCHNSSHSPSDKGKAQRLPSDRHDSSVLPLPNLGADSLPSDTNYGKLLLQLEKKLEEIGKYLERREQDAVAKKQTREEDYRVADMVYFEGNRGSSLAMFLNCLGERSLAKEFDEWETANYAGLSKLMTWIKDPTAFIRNDHTETFLKTIPIIHKEHARRGLQRGIKLLVIESLLETSGISALLAFTPHHLRMLTVGEIHKFTKWLNNERFSNVLELARNKSLWLGNCVRFYSGQTTPPTEISLPTEQREGINPRSNATPPSPTKRTHSFPQPVGKRICRDTAESWPSPTPANGFYQETEDGQGHRSNQGETQNTEGLAALAAAANLSSQAVGHITLQQVDNSQTRDATSPPWIEQYTQDFSHMGQSLGIHPGQGQSALEEFPDPAPQVNNPVQRRDDASSTAYPNTSSGAHNSVDAAYNNLIWAYEGSNGPTMVMSAATGDSDQTSFGALEWAYGLLDNGGITNSAHWPLDDQQGLPSFSDSATTSDPPSINSSQP